MTSPKNGLWGAPDVQLTATVGFKSSVRSVAHIHELEVSTGSTPGHCRISFPALHAEDAHVTQGAVASVKIGNAVVFRGAVVGRPIRIDGDEDQVELMLADDVYRLNRYVIGQPSVHTQGYGIGFKDVGMDIVFNRDGIPNRKSGEFDFNSGTAAIAWTYKSVLEFLEAHYFTSGISLDASSFTSALNQECVSLELTSMTVGAALDEVAALVGQDWALQYRTSGSKVVMIPAGGYGKKRKVVLFNPGSNSRATQAGEWAADMADVTVDVGDLRDVHYAVSAPALVEHTYSTDGENPLLIHSSGFTHKKFAARLHVDVTKYASALLGQNLTEGSRPKPWTSRLLRRLNGDGSAYTSDKDDVGADLEPHIWAGNSEAERRLLASGYEIDLENALIYLDKEVEYFNADGTKVATTVSDWSTQKIWLTVTTELEVRISAHAGEGSPLLSEPRANRVDYPDIVPARINAAAIMPSVTDFSASASPGSILWVYNPEADLQRHADFALVSHAEPLSSMSIQLPFLPICNLGDPVTLTRALGQNGREYIANITYTLHDGFQTTINVRSNPGRSS